MGADTTSKAKPLDTFALHLLHRAGQVANEMFHDQLRRQGVTPRQFSLLLAIFSKPGQKQSEIVEISGIDRSTLAEMVPRMVERGLVEKTADRADRRANSIKLTPAGRRLLRRCEAGARAAEGQMLANLTEAKRRNFIASLTQISNVDREAEPAKPRRRKPARPTSKKSG